MTIKNTTLFISDLHLDVRFPHITETFFYFLDHIAPGADALYILGDFFESYVGDDDHNAFTEKIIAVLSQATQHGLPIYLMPGNRDFLIGQQFAKRAGITLIPDPFIVTLYHQKIALMHGDSLCTDDKSHQRFRKIVNNTVIQKLFLMLPLSCRKKIADKLRAESKKKNLYKTREIMDVSTDAVSNAMQKYHVKKIIHGHTHRPMIFDNRIVLDAWHDHGNYLQVNQEWGVKLVNMPHK